MASKLTDIGFNFVDNHRDWALYYDNRKSDRHEDGAVILWKNFKLVYEGARKIRHKKFCLGWSLAQRRFASTAAYRDFELLKDAGLVDWVKNQIIRYCRRWNYSPEDIARGAEHVETYKRQKLVAIAEQNGMTVEEWVAGAEERAYRRKVKRAAREEQKAEKLALREVSRAMPKTKAPKTNTSAPTKPVLKPRPERHPLADRADAWEEAVCEVLDTAQAQGLTSIVEQCEALMDEQDAVMEARDEAGWAALLDRPLPTIPTLADLL